MSRKGSLIVAVSLLLGAGLVMPGVGLQTERAEAATRRPTSDPVATEFFHVTWTVRPARNGQSRITGYVFNDWWEPAANVVLGVNELDASGQVITAVGRPLVETITPHGRLYFDVQAPGRAASYDVGVSMFDFIQGQ